MQNETSHGKRIEEAQAAAAAGARRAAEDPHRLAYHVMAPSGWINDPNGFIQFKGEYHVFYQFHPYSADWGPMHWGHAVSADLVHWRHLPPALAPGEPYDDGGCFSGSAVDSGGKLTLVYTGNGNGPGVRQVQCGADSEDGVTFRKMADNPLVGAPPETGSADFRDPKVWKHGDEWRMIVGTGKEGRGKVVLYRSPDLRSWSYAGVIAEAEAGAGEGTMWECPDWFELDGRSVLVISPMGWKGHANRNVVLLGEAAADGTVLKAESHMDMDGGIDFYAAQTLLDDQGRRIAIAWMDQWGRPMPTKAYGWAGALTLPRVLSVDSGGRLRQRPVPETALLRDGEGAVIRDRTIPEGSHAFEGDPRGDVLELTVEFDLNRSSASVLGLSVRCSEDGSEGAHIRFAPAERKLEIAPRFAEEALNDVSAAVIPEPDDSGILRLHLFIDRSSLEVFADDGLLVMTRRIYPGRDRVGLRWFAEGGDAVLRLAEAWRLRDIWQFV